MSAGISVGRAIYYILSNNTAVKNLIGTKIYPLVLPELTPLPAIVYERNSDLEYSLDGAGISTSAVDITILSENYSNTMAISEAVYTALQWYKGTADTINIINIRLLNVQETYQENAFIQKLLFQIKSI